MGGAIAIKALLKAPTEWDGIVLVAPMCKVTIPLFTTIIYMYPNLSYGLDMRCLFVDLESCVLFLFRQFDEIIDHIVTYIG